MKITYINPSGETTKESIRSVEPPAPPGKRMRGPYFLVGKKPLLVSCGTKTVDYYGETLVYDKFDFTDPFTCVQDFLRHAMLTETSFLPERFVLRYYDPEPKDILLAPRVLQGEYRASTAPGTVSPSTDPSGGIKTTWRDTISHPASHGKPPMIPLVIAEDFIVDLNIPGPNEYFFPTKTLGIGSAGLMACRSLKILSGRTLLFGYGSPIVDAPAELRVNSEILLQDHLCGAGGIAPSPRSSAGATQGRSGSSGSGYNPGGGGTGGIYHSGSAGTLSVGNGYDGNIWQGGRGSYGNDDGRLAMLAYGSPTIIIAATVLDNQGTILSHPTHDTHNTYHAEGGRGAGGFVCLITEDMISQGTVKADRSPRDIGGNILAYGGSGGSGKTKVVTL